MQLDYWNDVIKVVGLDSRRELIRRPRPILVFSLILQTTVDYAQSNIFRGLKKSSFVYQVRCNQFRVNVPLLMYSQSGLRDIGYLHAEFCCKRLVLSVVHCT